MSPFVAFFLIPLMLLMVELGRFAHGRRKEVIHSTAIEGAVFGLFGLLLAFTFSGAISRFDEHRRLIIQETDAISTVWMDLAILPPETQPPLRNLLREYTNSRLHLYDAIGPEISATSLRLQSEIFSRILAAATSPQAHPDTLKLLLPPLNDMINITYTRRNAFHMHPPGPVFLLLFVFSAACAFIGGYGMHSTRIDWIYAVALTLAVTFTVYSTLETEFPRRGVVRFTQLDQPFLNLTDSMK
jgi:hypothetical protein